MYNTSTTFRDLMAQPSRQLTARGEITFSDNITQAITAAEIVYIQINEDAGAHLPLGGIAASSLSLHLDNRQGEWNPGGSLLGSRTLDGAIVKLEVGVKGATDYEYANLGIFVLEDAIGQEQEPVIVLRGADFLANKAEHPFSDNMTYPRTLSQLLTEVCAQAGITLKTPIFINSSVSLPTKPKWEEGTTCRGVIGYIACCAVGFARIDRNGHLEIVSFEHTPDYSIGTDRYIKLERQGAIFGPFNALSVYPYGAPHGYGATRIAADLSLVDNELNSIAVRGNPILAYESPVFNSVIETMRSTLNGLTFHGGSIAWQGDPTLTAGDVAGVTDLSAESLSLLILYQTITLDSGFSMQSGSKLTTNVKGQAKQEFVRVFTPTGKLNATALEGDINIHAGEQVNVLAGGQIVMEAADAIVLSSGKGVDTAISEKAASGDVTNLTTRVAAAEQKITPAAITATVRNHADYKSDLAGKNRTFVGGTPTGMIAGDLWIDSANGNLLKRYNGSAWSAVQDGAISIAQQQADKIQWLVASGTSAANMTLTSQLYSLMAQNIDLSANNSIKLAVSGVQVGGVNMLPGTRDFSGIWQYAADWTNDSILNGFLVKKRQGAWYGLGKNLSYSRGDYTFSAWVRTDIATSIIVYNNNGTAVFDKEAEIVPVTASWQRISVTFACVTAGTANIRIESGSNDIAVWIYGIKIEKGNKATDWTPALDDSLGSPNLLTGSRNYTSGTWNSLGNWVTDTPYEGFVVKRRSGQWFGLGQDIAFEPGVYTYSAYIKASQETTAQVYASGGTASFKQDVVSVPVTTVWRRVSATFICTAAGNAYIRAELPVNGITMYICAIKVEKGVVASPWEFNPEDPASGVKAAGIEITPGRMRQYASLDYEGIFGSGATEMGIANKRSDGLGIWLGGSPTTAKTRMWMDGVIQAKEIRFGNSSINQFTQMYSLYHEGIGGSNIPCEVSFNLPAQLLGVYMVRIFVDSTAPIYYQVGYGLQMDVSVHPTDGGLFKIQVDDDNWAGENESQIYTSSTAKTFHKNDGIIKDNGRNITALLKKTGGKVSRGMHKIELFTHQTNKSMHYYVTVLVIGLGAHEQSAPY